MKKIVILEIIFYMDLPYILWNYGRGSATST
ncbi:hypothetical protein J2S74_000350 [Evansella vedderi]|uniref:Uncharacterized protein n=1 Tax=Evansella vedderi TaxID=38282 RepID=A0ABT9ZP13_9BACI|nr:hypothetical protein [Evansella vedderi]